MEVRRKSVDKNCAKISNTQLANWILHFSVIFFFLYMLAGQDWPWQRIISPDEPKKKKKTISVGWTIVGATITKDWTHYSWNLFHTDFSILLSTIGPHEPCKFIQAFPNAWRRQNKKKKTHSDQSDISLGDQFSIWPKPILTALSPIRSDRFIYAFKFALRNNKKTD